MMKIIIEIINGKTSIQIDDQEPIVAEPIRDPTKQHIPEDTNSNITSAKSSQVPELKSNELEKKRKRAIYNKRHREKMKAQKLSLEKPHAIAPEARPKQKPSFPKPTPPVPMNSSDKLDPDIEPIEKVMKEQRAKFPDPWDCGMCRHAGSLCVMHESMEAEGKKPPRFRL